MKRPQLLSAVFALTVLLTTGWISLQWWPSTPEDISASAPDESNADSPALVVLTAAKASVADIRTEPIQRMSMSVTRMLPARFAYDDRRHVAVRAATDGVIESVHVKPGDSVDAGSVIAVLRSPAVGEARGLVLKREAELELANKDRDWQLDICDGVRLLIEDIRAGKPVETIEADVSNATLGKYRGELLAAYSQSQLARQLSGSASLSAGAISGRTIRERQSQQEQSRANLDALMEQSLFETQQACKTATAKAEAAKRSVMVARQVLANALGASGEKSLNQTVSPSERDLARLEVRSPLAGTVEERHFSATERITAGAEMFIIADTSALWVEADIRGRDWNAINIGQGDRVTVMPSNEPGQRYDGRVHYVGRQVNAATGAVPLVVEIANTANQFRPGLFARVEVPTDVIENTIVVPSSAVIDLDGQASVFARRDDGFEAIAVEVGVQSSGRIQIVRGLDEGNEVVVGGAFVLKSELLLEGEE